MGDSGKFEELRCREARDKESLPKVSRGLLHEDTESRSDASARQASREY